MAKQVRKLSNSELKKMANDIGIYDSNISRQELHAYVQEIMVRYGVNVLLQRMAPSIIDGLLPARRRSLFTMYNDMGSRPGDNNPFSKVADIAGRTIGKYHPHGLASVETCITNMGQAWSMCQPLIESQGNFGNIQGASPAAGRYIEGKLSHYSYECFFRDFDPDILDMIPNYTRRDTEPLYLPAKYPNFLITGNTGIGVGFTSNVPKFNLREAFELTIGLIDNPEMSKVHLYPDSPRGYSLVNRGDTISICEAGDGSYLMRGRMELVEDGKMRYIQITNVTEQTNMEKIEIAILKLIKDGKLHGISNIKDESDIKHLDYRLLLKPEADAQSIMNTIYKSTAMQDTMVMKLNFAEKVNFVSFGLKDAILEWIVQREDIKQRIATKKLRDLKLREHQLEIFMKVMKGTNLQRTQKIFTNSDNTDQAIAALVDTYGITSIQAGTLANMNNRQLTRDSVNERAEELAKLDKKIRTCESMIRGKDTIMNDIVKELEQGIALFGKDRICPIIKEKDTKVAITNHVIVVTKKFIKKLSNTVTHAGVISSGDEVVKIMKDVPNDGKVIILDRKGRIYNISMAKLLSNELAGKGTDLLQVFGISEDIVFVFWTHEKDDNENKYLTTFTENGVIKKTSLDEYSKLRTSVSQGALVSPEDNICYASITTPEHKDTLIYMNNGFGLILDLDNVSTTGRTSRGTNHVKLEDNVNIQGICDANTDMILVVTKKGYGKLCRLDDVNQARKKDDLTRITSLHDDDEVIFIKPVESNNVVKFIYEDGSIDMQVQDIPIETRLSKGKKIVPVKRGTNIIKVTVN